MCFGEGCAIIAQEAYSPALVPPHCAEVIYRMTPIDERNAASRPREVWLGVAFWAAFCVVVTLLRGVRWDESYEDARIFLREFRYPLDHPTYIFNRNGFSLQINAAAAMWRLWANALVFNGLHNVLFIAAVVFPPYLLGVTLGRRTLIGHIAVTLALLHLHVSFNSVYPLFVWPGLFSYGQVGTAWALLLLCALLAGRVGVAGLMLGIMPCIHIGQLPQLLPLAGVTLASAIIGGNRRQWTRMLVGGMLGAVFTGGFYLIVRAFSAPLATSGVYASDPNAGDVWKTFVYYYDPHRRLPIGPNDGNGHIAVAIAMVICVGCAWTEWRRNRKPGPWSGLALYMVSVAAAVYTAMAIQYAMGVDTPFWVTSWIPYRLINHAALILVPALAALLWNPSGDRDGSPAPGRLVLLAVLVFELAKPLFAHVAPAPLYARYIGPGDGVFLGLCGGAFAIVVRCFEKGSARIAYAAAIGATLMFTAALHRFGGACAVAGFAVTWLLTSVETSRRVWAARITKPEIALVCCAALVVIASYREWRQRETLPLSRFDRAVTRYLAEHGQDDAPILGGPGDLIFPTRTRHASVGDADPIKMVYIPSLFPAEIRIYKDLYGIHYDQAPGAAPRPTWRQAWGARSLAEWQALARAYAFRYVYAPADLPLQLPEALREDGGALYEIPDA